MGAPDLKQERRRFTRAIVDLSAICSTARETSPGIVRDLSLGGAFVESDALLPVGAKLRVGLVLPDQSGCREWIEGRVVRVVDVVPDGSSPGVSLRANGALFFTPSPCSWAASASGFPLASACAIAWAFSSPSSLILRLRTIPRMRSFTSPSACTEDSRLEARWMMW